MMNTHLNVIHELGLFQGFLVLIDLLLYLKNLKICQIFIEFNYLVFKKDELKTKFENIHYAFNH
jgi:hypothetical protein